MKNGGIEQRIKDTQDVRNIIAGYLQEDMDEGTSSNPMNLDEDDEDGTADNPLLLE